MKLNRSWNAAVKMIWNLPHKTHTRFLESLTSVPHLESTLMSRYIGFIDNLVKSKKSLLKLIFTSLLTDWPTLGLFTVKVQEDFLEGADFRKIFNKENQSISTSDGRILEDSSHRGDLFIEIKLA